MEISNNVKEIMDLYMRITNNINGLITRQKLQIIDELTIKLSDEEHEQFFFLLKQDTTNTDTTKLFSNANLYKAKNEDDYSSRMRYAMIDCFVWFSSQNVKGFNKKGTLNSIANSLGNCYGKRTRDNERLALYWFGIDKYKEYFGEKEYKKMMLEEKLQH